MSRTENFKLEKVSVRLVKDSPLLSDRKITQPEDAIYLLSEILKECDREVLCVINLKADGTPINCSVVSVGGLSSSIAHPREILKSSILSNAANMILMHNHPSGDLSASQEDIMVTDRMAKLCNLVGIPLLDHVIVGNDGSRYFSFKEKDLVEFNKRDPVAYSMDMIDLGKVAERHTKGSRCR